MPYVRKGKAVYKKVDGLKKVGTSKSVAKAKRHINVRRAVHHGWTPTGKPARDIRKRAGHNPGLQVVFSGHIPEESAWKGGKKQR